MTLTTYRGKVFAEHHSTFLTAFSYVKLLCIDRQRRGAMHCSLQGGLHPIEDELK